MEPNEILEGNKLIAEFMGIKKHEMKNLEIWIFFPNYLETPTELLKYHSSWDWLMPVVEKIESIYYAVIITQNICIIQANIMGYRTVVSKQKSNYDEDNTKLSNIYKAIVKFIKWYNKNNS